MDHPRVSIGLPVYNGENFLARTLESLFGQTYAGFELIISDNASTDGTREICEAWAARDDRLRYVRNETNRGAAWNFNNVFALSRGEYFKWAAHDDLCAPEFLACCIEVLDRDPQMVLCFSRVVEIDAQGRTVKKRDYIELPNLRSPKAYERFRDIVANRHHCEAVFGLIRSGVLRQTPLIGNYMAADRVLLAVLATFGGFHELPEYLFYQRDHAQRPLWGKDHEVTAWFDPARGEEIVFPFWRFSWEYLRAAVKAPLAPGERLRCAWVVARWGSQNLKSYKYDLSSGVDRVLQVRGDRPAYRFLSKWVLSGRLKLPGPVATGLAMLVMLFVEGFHRLVRSSPRS